MIKLIRMMALSLLVLTSACSKEEDTAATDNNLEKLVISSDDTQHEFRVEVADTKESMYKGLMGRTSLAENSGMLLDVNIVPQDMQVAMWMKDTLIPLDMIFIDENGEIFYIWENAVVNSTDPIYPPKRPRAVLEINAGQVAEFGIKIGDKVQNRLLEK